MLLLDAASGRFDLLSCASAHLHAANSHGARHLAICENLCRTLPPMNQSDFGESLLSYLHSFRQTAQIVQTNDLMLYAKDIREPALWQAAAERHLATLEVRLAATRAVMARARLDSLVSLARRL